MWLGQEREKASPLPFYFCASVSRQKTQKSARKQNSLTLCNRKLSLLQAMKKLSEITIPCRRGDCKGFLSANLILPFPAEGCPQWAHSLPPPAANPPCWGRVGQLWTNPGQRQTWMRESQPHPRRREDGRAEERQKRKKQAQTGLQRQRFGAWDSPRWRMEFSSTQRMGSGRAEAACIAET